MTAAPSTLQRLVGTMMSEYFVPLQLSLCTLSPFHLHQYVSTNQLRLQDRFRVHLVKFCCHPKIVPAKQRRQLNLRRLIEEIYGDRSRIYIGSLMAAHRWLVQMDGAHIPDLSSQVI